MGVALSVRRCLPTLHSASSLSTRACALTSMGQVCRKSTLCPPAVTKIVWCSQVHPSCFRHMMMAPVGSLTLLHVVSSQPIVAAVSMPCAKWCQLFVPYCLCPRHDGLDSAWVHRVALVHRGPSGKGSSCVLAWQAPSDGSPEGFQFRRRHAHSLYAVQTARRLPRFGDLARDGPVLLVELDVGHPLLGFGQPSVLRSTLPRCPCSVRISAQDTRVRDNPLAERLRRRGQCRFERTVRDQNH